MSRYAPIARLTLGEKTSIKSQAADAGSRYTFQHASCHRDWRRRRPRPSRLRRLQKQHPAAAASANVVAVCPFG